MSPGPTRHPPPRGAAPRCRRVTIRAATAPDALVLLRVFARAHRLPAEATRQLAVVLDEAISNIVRHGAARDPRIVVAFRRTRAGVAVTLVDRGRPFDPVRAADAPGIARRTDSRRLGLRLMARLADRLSYRRRAGENRLTIVKAIGGNVSRPSART